jgi:hypothetical protein
MGEGVIYRRTNACKLTVINGLRVRVMVFNATLNNISGISWWIRLKKSTIQLKS